MRYDYGDEASGEERYLQKIQESLQRISDLEMDRLRLIHFLSLTSALFVDPLVPSTRLSRPGVGASDVLSMQRPFIATREANKISSIIFYLLVSQHRHSSCRRQA